MRRLQHIGIPPTERQPGLSRWRAGVLIPIITLSLIGCIYDADKRCGNGQVVYTGGIERCVCDANSAWTASGCVTCGVNEVPGATGCTCQPGYGRAEPTAACAACGPNETAGPTGACGCAPGFGRNEPTAVCSACGENETTGATGACECAAGYGRTSPQDPCTPLDAGLGVTCDAQATPCKDTTYSYCAVTAGTAGYCTSQGCTASTDCPTDHTCDLSGSPSFCRRPPTGLGKTCTSDADCAGLDAAFCETFRSYSCLVLGCSLTPDNCPTGYECCDFTQTLGIPKPICVASALGGCPS